MLTSKDKMPPASKSSDPESSHLAEREVTESGARESQLLTVVECVKNRIGYTASELAPFVDMTELQLRRRLPDARELGLLKNGESRRSSTSDRLELTWYPESDSETRDIFSAGNKKKKKLDLNALATGIVSHVIENQFMKSEEELVEYVISRLEMIGEK